MTRTTIAILGAGGPAGIGVARALAQDPELDLVAVDIDPWPLTLSPCGRQVVLPAPDSAERQEAWSAFVYEERPDIVLPVADAEVEWAAFPYSDAGIPSLPSRRVLGHCSHKPDTAKIWTRAGLTRGVWWPMEPGLGHVESAARALGLPLWLRSARGTGAARASRIDTVEQGEAWLTYWRTRGAMAMMAEPYLPGRNIGVQMLFWEGDLIGYAPFERLAYPFAGSSPSGITGTPTLARTLSVSDPAVEVALDAVFAITTDPHGVLAVDLREDAAGIPRPTECNAGRFLTVVGLIAETGRNFPLALIDLARGKREAARALLADPWPEGVTWVRHLDALPAIISPKEAADESHRDSLVVR